MGTLRGHMHLVRRCEANGECYPIFLMTSGQQDNSRISYHHILHIATDLFRLVGKCNTHGLRHGGLPGRGGLGEKASISGDKVQNCTMLRPLGGVSVQGAVLLQSRPLLKRMEGWLHYPSFSISKTHAIHFATILRTVVPNAAPKTDPDTRSLLSRSAPARAKP